MIVPVADAHPSSRGGRPGRYGLPDVYGYADAEREHCGHCSSADIIRNAWGTFCPACCRWCEYHGPDQDWGDGMGLGGPHEAERRIGEQLRAGRCRADDPDHDC
jgi:hypothetical protein